MLDVELLALDSMERHGIVPKGTAAACRDAAPVVDDAFVAAVAAREEVTRHDTAAFVDVVQKAMAIPQAEYLHYGITSSDVVDTALCVQLTATLDVLIADSGALTAALAERARETIDVPVAGRTHGMFAEPTTFGA